MSKRHNTIIPGVTGVILAGGHSSRMGSNKALLPYWGGRFIESIYRQFMKLFDEILIVTNAPEQYAFLPCRKVSDIFNGMGALAGLHSGLHHAAGGHIFAVACDMPYLNSSLIARLCALRDSADVVIPHGDNGAEPLHAVYGKNCLPFMEAALAADRRRIISFFPGVNVCEFSREQVALMDPDFDSFRNINTPVDYYLLLANSRSPADTADQGRELEQLKRA